MSPAFIYQRNQIVANTYQSYQRIDASFFRLYNALRVKTNNIFAPFTKIYTDLNNAYDAVKIESLPSDVAANFTAFINEVNNTVWMNAEIISKMSLSLFGGPMMMGMDFLTPPSSNFKNSLTSLTSLFMRVNMPTMVSDACVVDTLSRIIPTIKPFVQQTISLADLAIPQIPTIFANATSISSNSFIELRSLIAKINNCARSKDAVSKKTCVDLLVS